VPVEDRGATIFPYGNIAVVQCLKGEEMKDCQSTVGQQKRQ
jgi:hypothetical protein